METPPKIRIGHCRAPSSATDSRCLNCSFVELLSKLSQNNDEDLRKLPGETVKDTILRCFSGKKKKTSKLTSGGSPLEFLLIWADPQPIFTAG
ncbi:hypothetical protein TNIN_424911 [Trichonephila inaurata madagascariensis]|uniref:Uncharacterized protein n=1 Tax=Trichonephila inaurata madagascariensis TaxID=2747483 RepID=A0A8X6I957_9ARAC|nr:hypothetical protein TNIN_424911 [Trichonephila inaurata madagascariensis]